MNKINLLAWFDKYTVIAEEEVDKKGVLFSWMPHGIISYVANFSRQNENSPFFDSILVGSRMAIKSPIFGSFMQMNGVYGANPDNF